MPHEPSVQIRLEAGAAGPRRGFGSVRVEARIGDVAWRTSFFPQKAGTWLLPANADVRRRAGISAGDEVMVSLELI